MLSFWIWADPAGPVHVFKRPANVLDDRGATGFLHKRRVKSGQAVAFNLLRFGYDLWYECYKHIVFIMFLAEREGFEPSMGYQPIHTFQACSFGRSDTSPGGRWRWRTSHTPAPESAATVLPPGLTGLTTVRREGADTATIDSTAQGGDPNGFGGGLTERAVYIPS